MNICSFDGECDGYDGDGSGDSDAGHDARAVMMPHLFCSCCRFAAALDGDDCVGDDVFENKKKKVEICRVRNGPSLPNFRRHDPVVAVFMQMQLPP